MMLRPATARVNRRRAARRRHGLRRPATRWQNDGAAAVISEGASPLAPRGEIVGEIAGFALFADLATPQLERVAHTFEEQVYADGERVLRQGLSGSAFHVILDGGATVVIDGSERATLARGDFFGEVSILLGQPPVADIVAVRPLRCLVLAGHLVQPFLLENPPVMYRMLQAPG